MATTQRLTAFLPSIKCSSCNADIEIARLADHICVPSALNVQKVLPSPPLPVPPKKHQELPPPSTGFSKSKPGRGRPPPSIDSRAANRPFLSPDVYVPSNHNHGSSHSFSGASTRVERPAPLLRSTTSPITPFPSGVESTQPSPRFAPSSADANGRLRTPESSGFQYNHAPLSPRKDAGSSIRDRMNTIKPGPFSSDRRQNSERSTSRGSMGESKHQRSGTSGSLRAKFSRSSLASEKSSGSRASSGLMGPSRASSRGGQAPPRPPRSDDIDTFIQQLQCPNPDASTHLGPVNRSRTFPVRKASQDDEPAALPSLRPRHLDPTNGSLHTPSDSGSSASSTSGFDNRSTSSMSSPPTSEVSGPTATKFPSRTPLSASMLSRPATSGQDQPGPDPNARQAYPSRMGRPNVPEPLMPSRTLLPTQDGPESPMDPAMQRHHKKWPSGNPPTVRERLLGITDDTNLDSPTVRKPGTKGNCRGCGEVIVGKSIKAADGRLTGRYHKQCFACKACQTPFATADFYVIDDFPYCAHHYHKLNGSLCRGCNQGIEGQYLETDRKEKFHPTCFTCNVCRVPLQDDYYEFGGRRLCERHAFQPVNQGNSSLLGPGRRFPERRTTRLMMM